MLKAKMIFKRSQNPFWVTRFNEDRGSGGSEAGNGLKRTISGKGASSSENIYEDLSIELKTLISYTTKKVTILQNTSGSKEDTSKI